MSEQYVFSFSILVFFFLVFFPLISDTIAAGLEDDHVHPKE